MTEYQTTTLGMVHNIRVYPDEIDRKWILADYLEEKGNEAALNITCPLLREGWCVFNNLDLQCLDILIQTTFMENNRHLNHLRRFKRNYVAIRQHIDKNAPNRSLTIEEVKLTIARSRALTYDLLWNMAWAYSDKMVINANPRIMNEITAVGNDKPLARCLDTTVPIEVLDKEEANWPRIESGTVSASSFVKGEGDLFSYDPDSIDPNHPLL